MKARVKKLRATPLALALLLAPAGVRANDCTGAVALLDDVARLIANQEADGWFSDTEAFRDLDEPMLESVCHASPEARARALEGLRRSLAAAGDPRELFRAAGALTPEAERALTLERRKLVLGRAIARADADCPFWLRAEPGFRGLQSDRERVTLSVETSGNVQLRQTEGEWTIGGGGIGRLLPGYGLDGRTTLLAGVEFGGGAMIRPGTSASQFVINYFPAVPLVFRTRHLTWHYDIETAPVALFQADDTRVSFGWRLGGAFGFGALRRRNVLPWAGVAVAYEHYFPGGGRERAHFIRGGLRVGLPWDP
jgi:hypothetical protein